MNFESEGEYNNYMQDLGEAKHQEDLRQEYEEYCLKQTELTPKEKAANKKLNTKTLSKYFLYTLLCTAVVSCVKGSKYDGLILTDNKTGRQYLLKYNIGDTYMIDEKIIKVIDNDTTFVFR